MDYSKVDWDNDAAIVDSLKRTRDIIDNVFGTDYASMHPELVVAFLVVPADNSADLLEGLTAISQSLSQIAGALHSLASVTTTRGLPPERF